MSGDRFPDLAEFNAAVIYQRLTIAKAHLTNKDDNLYDSLTS